MCKDALCPHLLLVKEAFPPSHSIGANFNSLSMMGEGDRRLGSVLLLADTLQNESVVEKKKKKTIFICFLCLSKYLKRRFWDILCLCTCHVHYWGHIHPMLWPVKCRMFWMWMSLDRAFILQFPLEHLPPHFHIYIGGNDVKSRNLQIGQKTLQYHWFW